MRNRARKAPGYDTIPPLIDRPARYAAATSFICGTGAFTMTSTIETAGYALTDR
jgi:hypothetical protein